MSADITLLGRPRMRNDLDPTGDRMIAALRYCHHAGTGYSIHTLAHHLGSRTALPPFHALLDEAWRAWPEPPVIESHCNPRISHDEALLVDICMAAARDERPAFEFLTREMFAPCARQTLWLAARRLMRSVLRAVGDR
ncbi:MAG: hypothetical protein ACOCYR_01735 [Erythrobacter sp.]|uniref:hypothetical protein n=1 Tax=Erythrobacter sp. HL-111 TaxID=1798193 RepID=UPI0006DA3995|nr:hypothetical protein [Erythrobacter sp. HL-111]KPP92925.1 MAG: Protein of unknown function (DUF1376) [Erythrobacteraceae bacterium HL-111]SDT02057.1 hypothetical protein SAMN04515621_2732 [Erythrobacter sp. HL-111]